jgi:hypothetical protein
MTSVLFGNPMDRGVPAARGIPCTWHSILRESLGSDEKETPLATHCRQGTSVMGSNCG